MPDIPVSVRTKSVPGKTGVDAGAEGCGGREAERKATERRERTMKRWWIGMAVRLLVVVLVVLLCIAMVCLYGLTVDGI